MSANTNNTPSTEGKAPENISNGTTATNTTSTTATTTATATEQIASGTTLATTTANGETAAPELDSAAAKIPDDYLKTGYFISEGKGRYTNPNLIDYAKVFGKALADSGTPASAMNRLVRTLKTASRLPYPAMVGTLKKAQAQAIDIEHRKKTGPLLREIINRNMEAIENEADYREFLSHARDIAIFLTDAQG